MESLILVKTFKLGGEYVTINLYTDAIGASCNSHSYLEYLPSDTCRYIYELWNDSSVHKDIKWDQSFVETDASGSTMTIMTLIHKGKVTLTLRPRIENVKFA